MVPQNVNLNCSGFCNNFCPRRLNCCGKIQEEDDEDKKTQKIVQKQLENIKETKSDEKKSGCFII